jgi:hypothetical protein
MVGITEAIKLLFKAASLLLLHGQSPRRLSKLEKKMNCVERDLRQVKQAKPGQERVHDSLAPDERKAVRSIRLHKLALWAFRGTRK